MTDDELSTNQKKGDYRQYQHISSPLRVLIIMPLNRYTL